MSKTTMTDIRRANAAAGGHWFDPKTLQFFRGRVGGQLYGGHWFVSSEQFDADSPRLYTVRETIDGGVTIGTTAAGFQGYASRVAALRAIRALQRAECGTGNCDGAHTTDDDGVHHSFCRGGNDCPCEDA